MKKILNFIIFLALLSTTACVPVTTSSKETDFETTVNTQWQELTTVRLNRSINMSYAPIFLAEKEGYFAEYGIVLEMIDFNRTAEAIPLVVSGDLDVYAGTVNAGILNTLFLEPNIRIVADRGSVTSDMDCTFQGILVRKDLYDSGAVRKPEDLKGLIVVTSAAGPGKYLLAAYLEQGGLTLEDIETSDIPSSTFIDSMANHTVDLISTNEPALSQVVNTGNAVLLAGMEDVIGDFQTSILAFGKNLLIDNPDLGARFLAAYLKGVAQYNEGKTEHNLQVLSEATGESVEILRNACWLPISKNGKPDFNSVIPFMSWSIKEGQLDQAITEEQFWDPSFLESAFALLEKGKE